MVKCQQRVVVKLSGTVRVGNVEVATHVTALYAHYLQDVIASVVLQDFEHGYAVDTSFQSVLPPPYRLMVYQRFVGVMTASDSGGITDTFFIPREQVVPNSVIEHFLRGLPKDHYLVREPVHDGLLSRLRERLLDALQNGGLDRMGDRSVQPLYHFTWLATGASVVLRFEPKNQVVTVCDISASTASTASRILRDGRYSDAAKSAASGALSQKNSEKKK
jgi:hypothetical protein